MLYPKLTNRDLLTILIIFVAVTLLTTLHFLLSDFPLFPETITVTENDKVYTTIKAQGAEPVDYETFLVMKDGDSTLIVDTRNHAQYVKGHIPGAVNIPYEKGGDILGLLEQMKGIRRVITYCDGDDCLSSIELAEALMFIFPEVYYFFGGWDTWIRYENPVERGEGITIP